VTDHLTPEQVMDREWQVDRHARLVSRLRDKRPVRLRHAGQLHPAIEAWGKALVAGGNGNLAITGPVGSGKTWSAWEVLERAVVAGYAGSILFASSAHWQAVIAPPVDRERLAAMQDAGVLVLDDLGAVRINDWQRECLLAVVDERWANARPTVITTNATSLRDEIGDRLASRLKADAVIVAIKGQDRRSAR
jgi:DNA replication protein DnaC